MQYSTRGAIAALGVAAAIASTLTTTHAADLAMQPMAGGWTSVSGQEDPVIKAAKFALVEQVRQSRSEIKLLAIKHARQQVVAGTNYSMNLMVQSEGKKRLAIAVVWKKTDGSMELTRWHWV